MREEHRRRRICENELGRPSQNELAHARVPVGAHHQEIELARRRIILKDLSDGASGGMLRVRLRLYPVQGKMPRKFGDRPPRFDRASSAMVTRRTDFAP